MEILIRPTKQNQSVLTEHQLDILRMVAEGYPNKLIAEELGLSPMTIKNWMHRICLKLDASCRTRAVVLALHKGLLLFDDGNKPTDKI